jgi:hypothetical protein
MLHFKVMNNFTAIGGVTNLPPLAQFFAAVVCLDGYRDDQRQ